MADFDFQQTAQELQEFVNRTPAEIAELRALYEALTQTGVTPVAADDWPVSDPQENVIYRVAGTSSYTDYMWNGTDFIPMATYNNVPTDIPAVGSTDVITAGGVANHGSAFDISEYNKNGETLATYANLAAALAAVPTTVQKGGMSVKFIQSSDNKYVQYRYMLTDVSTAATFTNVANWQGVDDLPTSGSKNFVTSDGVFKKVYVEGGDVANAPEISTINISGGKINKGQASGQRLRMFPLADRGINAGDVLTVYAKGTDTTTNRGMQIGFFDAGVYDANNELVSNYACIAGSYSSFTIAANSAERKLKTFVVPEGAVYYALARYYNIIARTTYNYDIKYLYDNKQNLLTWDDKPVFQSNNPVKSAGLYDDSHIYERTFLYDADVNKTTINSSGTIETQSSTNYHVQKYHLPSKKLLEGDLLEFSFSRNTSAYDQTFRIVFYDTDGMPVVGDTSMQGIAITSITLAAQSNVLRKVQVTVPAGATFVCLSYISTTNAVITFAKVRSFNDIDSSLTFKTNAVAQAGSVHKELTVPYADFSFESIVSYRTISFAGGGTIISDDNRNEQIGIIELTSHNISTGAVIRIYQNRNNSSSATQYVKAAFFNTESYPIISDVAMSGSLQSYSVNAGQYIGDIFEMVVPSDATYLVIAWNKNIGGGSLSISPIKAVKDMVSQTSSYRKHAVINVNHQGYVNGTSAGKNRKGSYAAAAKVGFDWSECDIRWSSDNEAVCCHDESFTDAVSGDTIVIAEHTLAELLTYNYTAEGVHIATLEDIIKECKENALTLQFDFKETFWGDDYRWEYVTGLVTKYAMETRISWGTGDYQVIYDKIRSYYPNSIVFGHDATTLNAWKAEHPEQYIWMSVRLDSIESDLINNILSIRQTLSRGVGLFVWPVDDPVTYKEILPYLDGIVSNKLTENILYA